MENKEQKTKTAGNGNVEERRNDAGTESDAASSSVGGSESSRRVEPGTAETSKFFRKRSRRDGDQGSSAGEEETSARKIPTNRRGGLRGKGRGPSDNQRAEQAAKHAEEGRHPGDTARVSGEETDATGGSEVERKARFVKEVEAAIKVVAHKQKASSKLKAIPAASASIMAAAEANFVGAELNVNEVAELRAEVARLTSAMETLQKENEKLRADLASLREPASRAAPQTQRLSQPVPVENQVLNLVRQELAAFQHRFSVLEGIVLRPPLGANKTAARPATVSYAAATAAASRPGPSSQPSGGAAVAPSPPEKPAPAKPVPAEPAPAKPATGKRGKAKTKKGKAAAQVVAAPAPVPAANVPAPAASQLPPPPPPPQLPTPPTAEAGWQVVGDKNKGKKVAKKAKEQERQRQFRARKMAARLRAPKTAAVVITLQPDAEKKGVTYRDLLAKAKEAVDLGELGITGGLRLKVTQTGARMLEIPGESSGATADALAAKLRASLDADEARVSRPVRCADLRIMGLDDSVSEKELVAAVARCGGCTTDQVRSGAIRPDQQGMHAATVCCPVTAAKTIVEGRRLLVGWVSAQVKLLEPRPLRCYRCLVGHHVSVKCASEVDRSGLCFRCCQPGHISATCCATPHCDACAATGKPADHRAGSKACVPPAKAKAAGRGGPSAATASVATAAVATAAAAAAAVTVAAAAAATPTPAERRPVEEAEMECL
ncbi:unnamed protein product [Parnassius mnemosyne]|uniref:CCHC-type domain-containing protein n=1 Tax=Parnassius mnemosyne TaxID=213953 RepID=A0AAV1K4P8_9NEOP